MEDLKTHKSGIEAQLRLCESGSLEALSKMETQLEAMHDQFKCLSWTFDQLSYHYETSEEEAPDIHTLTGNDYNSFKPTFKDKFIPSEGSIASFLYVYEAAMEGATDHQKAKHILSCLGHMAQEVMVPHMDALST